MKNITFLCITVLLLQQISIGGPVFSQFVTQVYSDYDEKTIDPAISVLSYFIQAIHENEINTIQRILSYQPDIIHQQDQQGFTPLHHALIPDDDHPYEMKHDIINELLNAGADTKVEDSYGTRPQDLIQAHIYKVEYDVDATDKDLAQVEQAYFSLSPDKPQYLRKRFKR